MAGAHQPCSMAKDQPCDLAKHQQRRLARLSSSELANQCADLEEELLSFPKAVNDDANDSAVYQAEIAQPPGQRQETIAVAETRQRLVQNQSR